MAEEKDIRAPPKSQTGDYVHAAIKAAISAVPVLGSPAAELFAVVISPPLTKRRDEWLSALAEGLEDLRQKVVGFSIEALADNEAFVSATLQATQIALRTHQREKLNALRNAVLNVAAGKAPDDDLQIMFLNYVDNFTTWHIRILAFFQSPERHLATKQTPRYTAGAPATLLEAMFDDLRNNRSFYDQVVKDLNAAGLLTLNSLHVMMTGPGMFEKRTTTTADRFLAFIAAPQ
jgi:hypothetical protein